MPNHRQLFDLLSDLDGKGYKAYQEIKGSYQFRDFTLIVEYVQGDPFASPSKLTIQIPQSIAQFPLSLYQSPSRAIALCDYLHRQFELVAKNLSTDRGSGKSGLITIISPGQEVLNRSAVLLNQDFIEVRFFVGLPAHGRNILGYQAREMLCQDIPKIVDLALMYPALNKKALQEQVETVEDADWLRAQLKANNLVAFIANGSILPRLSGVDHHPLLDSAIPFISPQSLEVEFNCPNRGLIRGMGIQQGITLIVGGGYHGKSTLLKALELGIYNHIPSDGRELVVTNPTAVKIRAEDGRVVTGVNISPFINHLPQGRSTIHFSSTNASGSTSQAANILEALETGTELLLLDEDTSATNFMIRDQRMQQLISKDQEPITPFVDKIKSLYTEHEVSTILVMGGSGDYFEVADTVIAMDNFRPQDVTQKAKIIADQYPNYRSHEHNVSFAKITSRIPIPESIDPSHRHHAVKLRVKDVDEVLFGKEDIDLARVEQIVETSQLKAIASAIVYAKEKYFDRRTTIAEILQLVMSDIEQQGLDILTEFPQGDLAMFRKFELAAALNRLPSLEIYPT